MIKRQVPMTNRSGFLGSGVQWYGQKNLCNLRNLWMMFLSEPSARSAVAPSGCCRFDRGGLQAIIWAQRAISSVG
jgi:hypothetical protein